MINIANILNDTPDNIVITNGNDIKSNRMSVGVSQIIFYDGDKHLSVVKLSDIFNVPVMCSINPDTETKITLTFDISYISFKITFTVTVVSSDTTVTIDGTCDDISVRFSGDPVEIEGATNLRIIPIMYVMTTNSNIDLLNKVTS